MRAGTIVIMAVLFEGAFLLLAWWLGGVLDVPLTGQVTFTGRGIFWGVTATLPLVAAMWWCSRSTWPHLVRLREILDRVVAQLFARCSLFDMAIISVMAGLGEETLFRGVLQTALAGATNVWLAILLISALFGLVHYISPAYIVYAGLIGAYLGLLLVVTGNLLAPILTHALFDLAALIYLVRFRPRSTPSVHDEPRSH